MLEDLHSLGLWHPPFVELKTYTPPIGVHYVADRDEYACVWYNTVLSRTGLRPQTPENFTVRSPITHLKWESQIQKVRCWHKDQTGLDQWVIVWASVGPTQIEIQPDDIYTPEPFEIVAFRNKAFRHRAPPYFKDRWFARGFAFT